MLIIGCSLLSLSRKRKIYWSITFGCFFSSWYALLSTFPIFISINLTRDLKSCCSCEKYFFYLDLESCSSDRWTMKDSSTVLYALTSVLLSVLVQTSPFVGGNQRESVNREIAKPVEGKRRHTSDSSKGVSCNCRNYCPDPNSSELEVRDVISRTCFAIEEN